MSWRERAQEVLKRRVEDPPPRAAPVAGPPAAPALQPQVQAWIDGLERLSSLTSPAGIRAAQWATMLAEARAFAERWGGQAHALGWTAGELFSLHPTHPLARLDHRGPAFLLGGREVVGITAETIAVRAGPALQAIHRRPDQHRPAWEVFT